MHLTSCRSRTSPIEPVDELETDDDGYPMFRPEHHGLVPDDETTPAAAGTCW